MSRIPSASEVGGLDRASWEDLCAGLAALLFDAIRVDDHHGRGNGLDAWRDDGATISGWQFRRYDDRFLDHQAADLRANIRTAESWARRELGRPLGHYVLVMNLDPQPGHGGATGEIERFERLRCWAQTECDVRFSFLGLNWVWTQLLRFPALRPDLFEDLKKAIREAEERMSAKIFDLSTEIRALRAAIQSTSRPIAVLIREAERHYDRGVTAHEGGDFRRAITCMKDAYRLAEETAAAALLKGRILLLLAGLEATAGFLQDAITHGRESVRILGALDARDYLPFAYGNLAFAYYQHQRYDDAEPLFLVILREFETAGNLDEVLRTVTHLAELAAQRKDAKGAARWANRLRREVKIVHRLREPTDVTLSAMGAAANAVVAARGHGDREAVTFAAETCESILGLAKSPRLRQQVVAAKAQLAQYRWFLGDYETADRLFAEVALDAQDDLPKPAADCQFNRSILQAELGAPAATVLRLLEDAARRYRAMGDSASLKDAEERIARISR